MKKRQNGGEQTAWRFGPTCVLIAALFAWMSVAQPPDPLGEELPPPPDAKIADDSGEEDFGFVSDEADSTEKPAQLERPSVPTPKVAPPTRAQSQPKTPPTPKRTARPPRQTRPPREARKPREKRPARPARMASPTVSNPSTSPIRASRGRKNQGDQPSGGTKLDDYLQLDPAVKGLQVKNFDLAERDIKDVVKLISKWTGKNFILDQKVRGKITILGPSEVTLQEAYEAFLSALAANGMTTVQQGKFIRIIESAEARRSPVKTYTGQYAPNSDQFITRIFQLRYINADEVQREFRDMTTRQGKLFAYEPTNSIIITDTGANIQRIKDILETLDVKSFETTLHVLPMRNSSAKAIAEMLDQIFGEGKGRGRSGSSSSRRSFRRSALERTRGGGVISKIIPDEQTNSLVVLANQSGIVTLKRLVAKLDVKTPDTGRIQVYYCEYAKAEDLAATLSALGEGGGSSARSSRRSSRRGRDRRSRRSNRSSRTRTTSSTGSTVTADLGEGVKITADPATNSLVIIANSADYATIKRVIQKLDIPRLQVFVQTAILEVALAKNTDIGLNLASGGPDRAFQGGFIGDAAGIVNYLSGNIQNLAGATIPVFAGAQYQQGNFKVSSFMGLLRLLTTDGNTSILSTPQIVAMDNEQAEFKVQDETPVQTSFTVSQSGQSTTLGNIPQGRIERLKTGIDIKLTPHINAASGSVRLEIEQQVDDIKAGAVPDSLANVQRATTSRVTNTTVTVKDKDYIMLGGLISDKQVTNFTKVPLLGDIPILGWLFKSKSSELQKTNLVILLQPQIIANSTDSAKIAEDHLQKRDKFIRDEFSGDDNHEESVNKIKDELEEQKKRGSKEPIYNYRNNSENVIVPAGQKPTIDAKSNTPQPPKKASTPAPALERETQSVSEKSAAADAPLIPVNDNDTE